jgi:uncharacterized Zn finger protein (UPF0148 family)
MDCPECGTPLVTYRLGDREAPVCEQCGRVGIEAEHRGGRGRVESWSDALRRFYGSTDPDDDLTVPVRSAEEGRRSRRTRAETWADALRRFYDDPERAPVDAEAADGASGPARITFGGSPAVRRSEHRATESATDDAGDE